MTTRQIDAAADRCSNAAVNALDLDVDAAARETFRAMVRDAVFACLPVRHPPIPYRCDDDDCDDPRCVAMADRRERDGLESERVDEWISEERGKP